jgi:hypothetical protein
VRTPWIDLLAGRLTKEMCKLLFSDSTTSTGWMKKSNFNTDPEPNEDGNFSIHPIEDQVGMDVCRHHALLCLENKIRDFSQWIRGTDNPVTDSLSQDHHLTNQELTYLLHLKLKYPNQVPKHFEIVLPPKEIISWLTSLLLKLPVKQQLQEKQR